MRKRNMMVPICSVCNRPGKYYYFGHPEGLLGYVKLCRTCATISNIEPVKGHPNIPELFKEEMLKRPNLKRLSEELDNLTIGRRKVVAV